MGANSVGANSPWEDTSSSHRLSNDPAQVRRKLNETHPKLSYFHSLHYREAYAQTADLGDLKSFVPSTNSEQGVD